VPELVFLALRLAVLFPPVENSHLDLLSVGFAVVVPVIAAPLSWGIWMKQPASRFAVSRSPWRRQLTKGTGNAAGAGLLGAGRFVLHTAPDILAVI
jgi:hypothetical protein